MAYLRAGIALVAVLMLGMIASASAFAALPEVEFLAGGKFPVEGTDTLKGAEIVKLTTIAGLKIACSGVHWSVTIESIHLGKFSGKLTECKEGTRVCTSEGAAAGEILTGKGNWHLVFVALTALQVGEVFELPGELAIKCGTFNVKVKGVFVASTFPLNEWTAKVKTNLKCLKAQGKNEFTSYFAEGGSEVTGKFLEANFGVAYEQACLEIGVEMTLTMSQTIKIKG
jgi:hypothetical protein